MLNQKKPQLVIRRQHPILIRVLIAAVAVMIMVAGYALFEYGRQRAGFDFQAAEQSAKRMQNEIDRLQADISKLHRDSAKMESARAIDRQANKSVRELLAKMQQEALELREELQFYRSIVSPQTGRPGVHIQHFKLDQVRGENGWSYRLTLIHVQAANKLRRKVWGRLKMTITGAVAGKTKTLSLIQFSKPKRSKIAFGFKYYKHFEGGVQLPAGFVPEKIVVRVVTGRGKLMTEKTFKWPGKSG